MLSARPQQYYARHPFPGGTGYRTRPSDDILAGHRAGEGLPSSHLITRYRRTRRPATQPHPTRPHQQHHRRGRLPDLARRPTPSIRPTAAPGRCCCPMARKLSRLAATTLVQVKTVGPQTFLRLGRDHLHSWRIASDNIAGSSGRHLAGADCHRSIRSCRCEQQCSARPYCC